MCGNRRNRAVRNQLVSELASSLIASHTTHMGARREGGVDRLIGAVNNMTIKVHEPPQYSNQVPVYPVDYKESLPKEDPPSYEKVSSQTSPDVVTREMTSNTHNIMSAQKPQRIQLPSRYQTTNPIVSKLVEAVSGALVAHQAGFGRRRNVRRAQKALRNQLYEDEIARREVMYGRLRCGERCEIWREVKAVNLGN